jgi:hypothetical protein
MVSAINVRVKRLKQSDKKCSSPIDHAASAGSPGVQAVEHVPVRLQQGPKEEAVEGTHRHMRSVAGRQAGVEVITDTRQAAVPHAVQVLQDDRVQRMIRRQDSCMCTASTVCIATARHCC